MRVLLGLFLLSCFSWMSNAAEPDAGTLVIRADPEQELVLITLASNPTTGYQWTLVSYDKTLLQFVKNEYIAPAPGLIGAEGQMSFTFRMQQQEKPTPQSTELLFKYAQPWQPQAGTTKKVIIQFQSSGDGALGINRAHSDLLH